MRNHRIVLATLGSYGDLHPFLALGLELARRGHIVSVATSEIYRDKVLATGVDFRPMRPHYSPDDPELIRKLWDLVRGPEFLVRELLMPALRQSYADLTAIAERSHLLVSGDIVYAAPLVAERLRLRRVSASLAPMAMLSAHDPSVLAPVPFASWWYQAPALLHRALLGIGRRVTDTWAAPLYALRHELGLPARVSERLNPVYGGKFSPDLNLALFSPVLARPQPDWPAHLVQTGFVFYDQQEHGRTAAPEMRAFLDRGAPPIVFTLGSAAVLSAGSFYDDSIAAALQLGRRALLLTGPNVPSRPLPDGVAATDYAPHSEVFPRAACVVHQGGIGTTAQALRAGVPQVIVPFGFDQPDNAARCERLGVARSVARRNYNAGSAAKAIGRVLEEGSFAKRAQDVAVRVRREDGVSLAGDAITRLLDGGPERSAPQRSCG